MSSKPCQPAYYHDFRRLYGQVAEYAAKDRGLPEATVYFNEARLNFFLREEIRTCTVEDPG